MDFNFISKAFLATLGGVPVTLLIMVVSILLSFFPALFLALGQIYKVKGVRSFSVIYLAFIPRDASDSLDFSSFIVSFPAS